MTKKQEVARRTPHEARPPIAASVVSKREVTKSDKFYSLYVNDIEVQTSAWDLRMLFGEMGDTDFKDNHATVHITRLGEVRMSPQLAKKLTLLLADQLKAYETNFGPIPTPPE